MVDGLDISINAFVVTVANIDTLLKEFASIAIIKAKKNTFVATGTTKKLA